MRQNGHQIRKSTGDKPGLQFQVVENDELMKFLIAQLPHKSRTHVKSILKDKQVLVNEKVITQFDHPLKPGDKVEIRSSKISEEKPLKGITILFEDKDIVVIDKHAGLLSIASEDEKKVTAYSILSRHVKIQNRANKIFVVHRLDRDTSGVMMFAKSERVQEILQSAWNETVLERSYIALVEGMVEENEGLITSYLKETTTLMVYSSQNPAFGQKAITQFEVMKKNRKYSLLKINLHTGRKNQIRVHMQDIGHSIVGDKKYGAKENPIGRLGLHAVSLAFTHPTTQEQMRFETSIPRKFLRLF